MAGLKALIGLGFKYEILCLTLTSRVKKFLIFNLLDLQECHFIYLQNCSIEENKMWRGLDSQADS